MAVKRIWVTGAGGSLGSDLVPFLQAKGYQVHGSTSSQLNLLSSRDEITRALEAFEPQLIVHAAAYTNVDGAERDPELAMAVNNEGTRRLVEAAMAVDAIVAYISTDYVFDGDKGSAYTIADRPNPISVYGQSKYYGELALSELTDTHYIIRTSWLYGQAGRNFVQFVLSAARQGRDVGIIDDQWGKPTWTGSLCDAIERVMTSGAYGTYHAADEGPVTRYEQARVICRALGLSGENIRPISSAEFPQAARRPRYSVLDSAPLAMPSWETGLQAFLSEYKAHELSTG